ncbi:hypothetical protein B9479_000883 [Cryptococcus floricola]|uniref:Uncharacterized protein n=1 Tax=Cryptococcus floricola TaxID=2591691 RepID=A0A5D3B3P8_9TREE|nr:hypothetical protein B9479_000883 [Cryptococcus floricola]
MSVPYLTARRYIEADRQTTLDTVRRELNAVVNALPTQIQPTEREAFLDAILHDLEVEPEAAWHSWPEDVHLLALTAIKFLGRNPVGSETLLSAQHISILIYHSCLPVPGPLAQTPASPSPCSTTAREALKVLANLLVLSAAGRTKFFRNGGADAVSKALAQPKRDEKDEAAHVERIFLLGRLGFLVCLERPDAAKGMVEADVIDALVQHLMTLPVVPAHYMALSELLKLTNALLSVYPYKSVDKSGQNPWDEQFDIILYPLLHLFYEIPAVELSPPLTHVINALLSVPFLPRLLPTWTCVPDTTIEPLSSPTSTVRTLLHKLGNLASPSSPRMQLAPPRSRSPALGDSNSASSSPRASLSGGRPFGSGSSQHKTAFPARLLKVLDTFFSTYLPYPKKPDDKWPQGLVPDEVLPPVLLLLTRAAVGCDTMRVWMKGTLLPPTLDRTPEAGPIEKRKGLLGNILRLMGCGGHTLSKVSAGEFMWAVCNGDASDLSAEIGYGNAAGVLLEKGFSGPPPAKITELWDESSLRPISMSGQPVSHPPDASSPITIQPATPIEPRHPITGLQDRDDRQDMNEMSDEEKEREAERLFALFDRMERNPVISMKSGEGQAKGIQDIMRDKLEKGELEAWQGKDDEAERRKQEEQEQIDETEALREIQQYKQRTGRS